MEVVLPVGGIAADAQGEELEGAPAARHLLVIALDAAVGKVDAEEQLRWRCGHVQGAGGVLGIDDTFASVGVAEGISCVGASCFWGESKSGVD